jgi:hypothetical protein
VSLRVTLERSGGVAGFSPPPLTVDSQTLPAAEAQRLQSLIDAACFFDLAADLSAPHPAPDSFGYTLSIADDATARRHSVAFDAASAPPELKALVTAVRSAARGSVR